jgi:hypothetical protein
MQKFCTFFAKIFANRKIFQEIRKNNKISRKFLRQHVYFLRKFFAKFFSKTKNADFRENILFNPKSASPSVDPGKVDK